MMRKTCRQRNLCYEYDAYNMSTEACVTNMMRITRLHSKLFYKYNETLHNNHSLCIDVIRHCRSLKFLHDICHK